MLHAMTFASVLSRIPGISSAVLYLLPSSATLSVCLFELIVWSCLLAYPINHAHLVMPFGYDAPSAMQGCYFSHAGMLLYVNPILAYLQEWLAQEVEHWRGVLAGVPPLLEMPFDYTRPVRRSGGGARTGFTIPHAVSQRLRHVATEAGATEFVVLLAAYKAGPQCVDFSCLHRFHSMLRCLWPQCFMRMHLDLHSTLLIRFYAGNRRLLYYVWS